MIPVLIVPVLNRPDLLERMVASIDHEVGTLLVIDNSPELGMGDVAESAIDRFVTDNDLATGLRRSLVVTEPPRNLGVAASWNLGIKSYPEAEWWLIANADVEFSPGDLERLVLSVRENPDAISCLVEFAAFALPRAVVDRVGLFDENFAPIYYEDTDYLYRCRLEGVGIVDVPGTTKHAESVSYRGNHHAADNARTFPANADYYRRKWGGPKGQETFTHPFGSDLPSWAWRLEVARLAGQRWTP